MRRFEMPLAKPKERRPASTGATYQGDFYTWTQEQGALLRAGRFEGIDRENIAEEIESLGRSEFDKLVSFYRLVLLHMLKCDDRPEKYSRSWAISIENHRDSAAEVLADNPGLKPRIGEAMTRAYRHARRDAADETRLPMRTFPTECPYTLDEIGERPFPYE
jgi:Domain of unknown function DUF29